MGEIYGFDASGEAYPELESGRTLPPGNSSGIVDGAAAVLIGNKEAGGKIGKKPRARIRAFANIGSEPAIMLTGPIDVTLKVLKKAGMKVEDIDLFELNEAFASVVLRYMQALDIPHDKINVNGGAIAMGHPLGATGAMIFGTVLDELERSGKQTALVTLCIGIGMGTATIIDASEARSMPNIDTHAATRVVADYPPAFKPACRASHTRSACGRAPQFGVTCRARPVRTRSVTARA